MRMCLLCVCDLNLTSQTQIRIKERTKLMLATSINLLLLQYYLSFCSSVQEIVPEFSECKLHMSFPSAGRKEDMADCHIEAQRGRKELHYS